MACSEVEKLFPTYVTSNNAYTFENDKMIKY